MSAAPVAVEELSRAIRNVPDFPKAGIQFKDITPLLANARLFSGTVEWLTSGYNPGDVDLVAGIDARGFIFAAAAAQRLGTGFVPIRKQGKLPYQTLEESYDLEYGSNTIAVHTDALRSGDRVLLIDDLLATGGTAAAAAKLLQRLGAQLLQISVVIELAALGGRAKLQGLPLRSLVVY